MRFLIRRNVFVLVAVLFAFCESVVFANPSEIPAATVGSTEEESRTNVLSYEENEKIFVEHLLEQRETQSDLLMTDEKRQADLVKIRLLEKLAQAHARGEFSDLTENDIEALSEKELIAIFNAKRLDSENAINDSKNFFDENFPQVDNQEDKALAEQIEQNRLPDEKAKEARSVLQLLEQRKKGLGAFVAFATTGLLYGLHRRESLNEWGISSDSSEYFALQKAGISICDDQKSFKEANEVTRRLLQFSSLSDEEKNNISVKILDSDDIAGMESPINNTIFVSRGVIDRGKNCAAYVIGHELAHMENKHADKSIDAITYGGQYLSARTSALREHDADSKAYYLLVEAGYNPGAAAASILEFPCDWETDDPLASHPSHESRYKHMLSLMEESSGGRVVVRGGGKVLVDGVERFSGSRHDACLVAGKYVRGILDGDA